MSLRMGHEEDVRGGGRGLREGGGECLLESIWNF